MKKPSAAVLLLFLVTASSARTLEARIRFQRDVQPILATHCVRCHGADRAAKGLRLHSRERAMLAIKPRDPENSRAYVAARSGFMPPGEKKLSPRELELFRRWIAGGARWPKHLEIAEPPSPSR